jgi:hypothetical protein
MNGIVFKAVSYSTQEWNQLDLDLTSQSLIDNHFFDLGSEKIELYLPCASEVEQIVQWRPMELEELKLQFSHLNQLFVPLTAEDCKDTVFLIYVAQVDGSYYLESSNFFEQIWLDSDIDDSYEFVSYQFSFPNEEFTLPTEMALGFRNKTEDTDFSMPIEDSNTIIKEEYFLYQNGKVVPLTDLE